MKTKLVLGCFLPLCVAAYFYLGAMQTADAGSLVSGSSWVMAQSTYTLSVWQDPLITSSVYLPLVSTYQDNSDSLHGKNPIGEVPVGTDESVICIGISCICSQYTFCQDTCNKTLNPFANPYTPCSWLSFARQQ